MIPCFNFFKVSRSKLGSGNFTVVSSSCPIPRSADRAPSIVNRSL